MARHPHSRVLFAVLTLGLLALVCWLDWITGYEISFSVFYLVPIVVAAWYVGSWPGYAMCVIGAAAWYFVDMGSDHRYSSPAIPVWNAVVRLTFFGVTTALLLRLKNALKQLDDLARHDGMTGLLNSRSFAEAGERMVRLAARHRHPFVVAYIDLDGFKGVNDRFGHARGDEILRGVAQLLSARLRLSDVTARLGGDEFAVLCLETDLAGARCVFANLHQSLCAAAREHGWPVGFSMGGVVSEGTQRVILDQAVRAADDLMYRVKTSGKNAVHIEALPPPESPAQQL